MVSLKQILRFVKVIVKNLNRETRFLLLWGCKPSLRQKNRVSYTCVFGNHMTVALQLKYMDWTTPLKSQQADFIARVKCDRLLNCDVKGKHSELTVISGDKLKQLRDFCWSMVNKYKEKTHDARSLFVNNLKGKLAEEVVKARLGDFVTEVDYETLIGGDGGVDLRLTSDSSIGIQVKSRQGSLDTARWLIKKREIDSNAVLVCVLINEEVSEAQTEYNLIMAGFLPTFAIDVSNLSYGKASVTIDELFYAGGLRSYLESLQSPPDYISLAKECFEKEDYEGAIVYFNEAIAYFNTALKINPNNAKIYYNRARARYMLKDYHGAISDYTEIIKIHPGDDFAYDCRGWAHLRLGNYEAAYTDFYRASDLSPYNEVYLDSIATLNHIVMFGYRRS